MNTAIKEAKKSFSQGGIPISSVLVKDNKIIGMGHSDILQPMNWLASNEFVVYADSYLVPASTTTAFFTEGLTLSPQALISVSPTVSRSIFNEAFKSR